jgi:hypothetical protein
MFCVTRQELCDQTQGNFTCGILVIGVSVGWASRLFVQRRHEGPLRLQWSMYRAGQFEENVHWVVHDI